MDKLVEGVQRSVLTRQQLPMGTPRKGMLCLAEYLTDGKWYRARIIGRLTYMYVHCYTSTVEPGY